MWSSNFSVILSLILLCHDKKVSSTHCSLNTSKTLYMHRINQYLGMNQQLFDLGVPTGLLYSTYEIQVCIRWSIILRKIGTIFKLLGPWPCQTLLRITYYQVVLLFNLGLSVLVTKRPENSKTKDFFFFHFYSHSNRTPQLIILSLWKLIVYSKV